MDIQRIDNESDRHDIWNRVYAHVFSALVVPEIRQGDRLVDYRSAEDSAQKAADEAISNIPRSIEVVSIGRGTASRGPV